MRLVLLDLARLIVLTVCLLPFGAASAASQALSGGWEYRWGALMFALAVVAISLWHYARTQQAHYRLKLSQEQQVAERTEKAETLARREQVRVRLLTFENEKTRSSMTSLQGFRTASG